jgi:hypothetical protein
MDQSNGNDNTIKQLTLIKSAYFLEADASMARGLEATAMGLFIKAAELELELAEHFDSRLDHMDAEISRFSAASCFFRARQYRRASALLKHMPAKLAKAKDLKGLLAECAGKEDVPLTGPTPGLQALIGLLVKKNVIDEGEWAAAIAAH